MHLRQRLYAWVDERVDLESLQPVHQDAGHDLVTPGLVVGRDDVPGGFLRAGLLHHPLEGVLPLLVAMVTWGLGTVTVVW